MKQENSVAETSAKSIPETGEVSLTEIKQDSAINSSVDPVAGIVEAALAEDFEVLEELGNEGAKAAESVARSCSESFQMFATETADYAKQCFESRAAFAGALLGTKSFESAVQVQTSYAKSAYARFLAQKSDGQRGRPREGLGVQVPRAGRMLSPWQGMR